MSSVRRFQFQLVSIVSLRLGFFVFCSSYFVSRFYIGHVSHCVNFIFACRHKRISLSTQTHRYRRHMDAEKRVQRPENNRLESPTLKVLIKRFNICAFVCIYICIYVCVREGRKAAGATIFTLL